MSAYESGINVGRYKPVLQSSHMTQISGFVNLGSQLQSLNLDLIPRSITCTIRHIAHFLRRFPYRSVRSIVYNIRSCQLVRIPSYEPGVWGWG